MCNRPPTSRSGRGRFTLGLSVCILVLLAAGLPGDERRFAARVYPDRTRPDYALSVMDLRVNETLRDEGGVRHLVLRSAAGTFDMPFEAISEIEFTRFLGLAGDLARYDSRVTLRSKAVRVGQLELRVLRGTVDALPWHLLLATRDDRGAGLYKIVFLD